MNEKRMMEILFDIHSGTPRQGPGDTESTLKALGMTSPLNKYHSILDVGCGSGAQTKVLWENTEARIVAVDFFSGFIDTLNQQAAASGQGHRVSGKIGDMANLEFDNSVFDLIWSEGAIYVMGFENGLTNWKQFLKPGGYIAVTEVTWLTNNAPEECVQFWNAEYPAITSIEQNLEIIKRCGYENVGHFPLPSRAWTENYYASVKDKLPAMEEKYKDDEFALQIIHMTRNEMELYHAYGDHYGYVFYVAKR